MIFLQYNNLKVFYDKKSNLSNTLFIYIYQDAAKLVKITKMNKNNHLFNL